MLIISANYTNINVIGELTQTFAIVLKKTKIVPQYHNYMDS